LKFRNSISSARTKHLAQNFVGNNVKWMTQNVGNFCSVQVFSILFWSADREMAISKSRRTLSLTRVSPCYWVLWFVQIYYKSNQDKLESSPNQLTTFQIKSSYNKIKSLGMIQSRFKSNHDLVLPITTTQQINVTLGQSVWVLVSVIVTNVDINSILRSSTT